MTVSILPLAAARGLRSAPPTALFGMAVIALYVAVALLAPLIAPYGETEIVDAEFMPWSAEYLLGTDNLGRDMLSRIIYGARNTVGIAVATTVLAFLVGAALGILAALRGGWVDQLLGRTVDVLMAIPSLIFKLLLLTIFGT